MVLNVYVHYLISVAYHDRWYDVNITADSFWVSRVAGLYREIVPQNRSRYVFAITANVILSAIAVS